MEAEAPRCSAERGRSDLAGGGASIDDSGDAGGGEVCSDEAAAEDCIGVEISIGAACNVIG